MGTLEIHRNLGHFRIDAPLGQGGMGEVYLATDLSLGRPVALKILPESSHRDPEARERFLQEARFASVLNHPHIVTIYSVDEVGGIAFIAMEYVEGETLRARARRAPLAAEELIDVGIQCAEALGAAHAVGILHRDIKSANVILAPRMKAKILDFGLAKRSPEGTAADVTAPVDLTAAGIVMGSPGYMSPEQARGETLDARTDIFSLGCTLYEAATGRVPFEGPSPLAVMHATWTQEPPPPSRERPELPAEIDAILARCMAKSRDDRFGSALELADALAALRDREHTISTRILPRAARAPNNLPAALTSFVGRRRETGELRRLLGQARLVTVAGPGGSGKTRLAIQVASDLLAEAEGGAWLVALAPLADPALVPQHVAAAIGVREESGRPVAETLAAAIGEQAMILVLDNCEHLVVACAALADALLDAAPRLRVLATSQEPLGVPGEVVWRIPMMGVPDPAAASRGRETVGRYEAVRLFVDRAAAVQPGFALTDRNAAAVASLCRRLDGIPLAIELAAARVKVLTPEQILARLEDRFKLLTGGSRTALPRQQTLRAAVDWSYELLTESEKTLLRRLSVFAGGFTLESAESVCGFDVPDPLDLLDALSRLVDRSLVVSEEAEPGAIRYRLLETIRAYGLERLAESGERRGLLGGHAAHFLELAERAEPELRGPGQAEWLNRLAREHDNLRAALSTDAAPGGEPVRGLRLAAALWRFWWVRGNWAEGRARLAGFLAAARASDAPAERQRALRAAAVLARGEGDYAAARPLLEEALATARRRGDEPGVALMLLELGNVANDQEDYAAARPLYEESLALRRRLGDRCGIAAALHNLGVVAAATEDFAGARSLYEEALGLHRELGNRAWEAASLNGLGGVASYDSELEDARGFHEAALTVQRELGDSRGTAFSLRELGKIATDRGDLAAAAEHLAQALAIDRELGDRQGIASTLEGSAALAAAASEFARALRLAGAAASIRESIQAPISGPDAARMERFLAPARRALGAGADAEREVGGRLPLDESLRLALEPIPGSTGNLSTHD